MLKKSLYSLGVLFGILSTIILYNYFFFYLYLHPAEEVRIDRDEFSLAATVLKPENEGVFPAIVYLHGSGQGVRSYPEIRGLANEMVRRGFVVLTYDKRGSGESGGDFAIAHYSDFINDALAAIEYLQGRKDVDADRVGIYVVSESGWFGPEIAVRNGKLAFIINRGSPTVSFIDSVLFEMENEMRAEGFTPTEIGKVLKLRKRIWDYYKAALGANNPLAPERQMINRLLQELGEEIGPDRIPLPAELIGYDRQRFQNIVSDVFYDPQPFLENLNIPQLYLYAGEDENIPTYKSVDYLEGLMAKTEKDYDIHIFPGVDHSFFTWKGIFKIGYPPRYLELVGNFAEEIVGKD